MAACVHCGSDNTSYIRETVTLELRECRTCGKKFSVKREG